jgi:opacity protein-like surface antigen
MSMKKSMILLVLLAACIAVPAQAQEAFTPSWNYGFDLRGALPMGDFKDIASFGFGGTAYGGYAFSPMFAVTARTGYIFTGGKEIEGTYEGYYGTATTNYGIVPLLGGVKVFFMEGDTRVYAAAEAGMYFLTATAEVKNPSGGAVTSASNSDSKFGYAPALGAQFRAGMNMMVDAHVDYTAIPDDAGDLSWLTFAVGIEWTMN